MSGSGQLDQERLEQEPLAATPRPIKRRRISGRRQLGQERLQQEPLAEPAALPADLRYVGLGDVFARGARACHLIAGAGLSSLTNSARCGAPQEQLCIDSSWAAGDSFQYVTDETSVFTVR
jgi:hypothetical protein